VKNGRVPFVNWRRTVNDVIERVQGVLSDIELLRGAEVLLRRVAGHLPSRRYELLGYPERSHPDALSSVIDSLERAVEMHRRLESLYVYSGAYEYPEGYEITPESERVWSDVQGYFGFDDSE
jgi:hypothetical protein